MYHGSIKVAFKPVKGTGRKIYYMNVLQLVCNREKLILSRAYHKLEERQLVTRQLLCII